jgi:hypothetical protein
MAITNGYAALSDVKAALRIVEKLITLISSNKSNHNKNEL